MRLLVTILLGIVGDPTYLARFALAVAAGTGVTGLTYLLSPRLLPLWPGVVIVLLCAVGGVIWEVRNGARGQTLSSSHG